MSQVRSTFGAQVAVAAVLAVGAAYASEKPPPPPPWHVQAAEIRVPVTVAVRDALLRMPPQDYLADLKPTETTGGLAFDPENKGTILHDPSKRVEGAGNKGSSTYALKPEYRWFSWRAKQSNVYVDGQLVPEEKIYDWRKGGRRPIGREEAGMTRLVAIPEGAKTLKIEREEPHIFQTGFLTKKSAEVAHAILCLSGHDPSQLIPVVHRRSGERVGCRVVWAEATRPMSILFDCSSGDREYLVYLVDRARNPQRLDWVPKAGIVEELRHLARYDPALETLDGFRKLWDSATVAGKGVPLSFHHVGSVAPGQPKPARVIYRGHLPFGSTKANRLGYTALLDSQPASMSRSTGFFHMPATGSYRFLCAIGPGGYLLFDGQVITKFRGGRGMRLFDIQVEKGPHRLDVLQFGPTGRIGWAALWWKNPVKTEKGKYHNDWFKFGETNSNPHMAQRPYLVWEPMADTETSPVEIRNQSLAASFTWSHHANLMGGYPSHDLNWYHFAAHVPDSPDEAIYRWRFSDGLSAEGQQVVHLFLSPGRKKIQLEVLSGPGGEVIGRAEGEIHVQLVQPSGISHMMHQPALLLMVWDYGEEEVLEKLSLDELASLYYWSYPVMLWYTSQRLLENHHPRRKRWARRRFAETLAPRVDELINVYPYSQLLQTALGFSNSEHRPTEAEYDAAEKLLKVVLERAPAGSSHWRTASFALAELYHSVRDKPKEAYALLKKVEETLPAIDLGDRWEMARPRKYHHLADTDNLSGLTDSLEWSPITRPRDSLHKKALRLTYENGRGLWFANQFDLPADWNAPNLIYEVRRHTGLPWAAHKYVWINGHPLGRMWQWRDGNIIIPARFLNKGATNRITWLLQLHPQQYQAEYAGPALSADLKARAWAVHDRVRAINKEGKRHDSKPLMVLGALPNTPRSLAITRDGTRYASGHQYGEVKLWEAEKGQQQHSISVGALAIVALEYSPDGKLLAVASEDSVIMLLDAATGQTVRSLAGHTSEILALAFSPDGNRLASGSFDKTVKIWDVTGGNELLTLQGHAEAVQAVAFSPDGKRVASAVDRTRIRICDAASGNELRTLDDEKGEVLSLAFSPDGRRLASGRREKTVSLWDLESGKKLALTRREETRPAHNGPVTRVQFSLDSKQLVSLGGSFGKFWNTDSGKEEHELYGLEGYTRVPEAWWYGRHKMAKGFEYYPITLYTSEACEEHGMNYACYDGKWDKLPDFDRLKPVRKGKLKRFDNKHLQEILLRWRVITDEGQERTEIRPSGLKLSGYLKVAKAGDYEFTLRSGDGSQLFVGSDLVIDNDGLKNNETQHQDQRGTVHLEPGVHPLTVTYFHVNPHRHLHIKFPEAIVRDLAVTEVELRTAMGKARWLSGEKAEGQRMLENLEGDGWPLDDTTHWQLSGTLRHIRHWAGRSHNSVHGAFEAIDEWQVKHPMLVLVPEFMLAKTEAHIHAGDYPRGLTLARQLSEFELTASQQRKVLLSLVKWNVRAGNMDAAREAYQKLKNIAPTSTATAEAREAIKEAVLKQFDGK